MTQSFPRRTWLEIDLDALVDNYRAVLALTAPCASVAVVLKANAYGLGAVRVAQCLAAEGAAFFAVSCVREGLQLRQAGISGTILVMSLAEPELYHAAMTARLTLTIDSVETARALSASAALRKEPFSAHVKIDTGFHRLGLPLEDPRTAVQVEAISRLPYVLVEGIYGHLPLRDAEEDQRLGAQMHALCTDLQKRQCAPFLLHLVDSIGLVRYPQFHHNLVRIGAFLYGVRPSRSEDLPFACKPVARFFTTVIRLHSAEAGQFVGYDDAQPLPRRTLIATLPAGYGDGFPRALSGVGQVAFDGKTAPILGLICMDHMMVDVTDVPGVALGQTAELLGDTITLDNVAQWASTNRNEILARLSARPQRVYMRKGEVVQVDDALR